MLSRSALQQFTAKLCSIILARACKNTIRAGKMLSQCALQQFTAKLCSTILARACENTIRAGKCSHSARYSAKLCCTIFARACENTIRVGKCSHSARYRNSLQNCAPPFSRVLVKIQFVVENALTVRVTAIHCKTVLHHSRACLLKYNSW